MAHATSRFCSLPGRSPVLALLSEPFSGQRAWREPVYRTAMVRALGFPDHPSRRCCRCYGSDSCGDRGVAEVDDYPIRESPMIRLTLLALLLTLSPVHAEKYEKYCDGILTTSNVCVGSESDVPPVIRCDYPDSSDPRCIGVGESRPVFNPPLPKSRAPR
jgi:hypothetical protein